MGEECKIGFSDLFQMAKGRIWTSKEENHFQTLNQPARNILVKDLAREAGNIVTKDRTGTDGLTYTAFWVKDSAQ